MDFKTRMAIVRRYLSAFANMNEWNGEDHENGLIAVYKMGVERGIEIARNENSKDLDKIK